MARGCQLLAVRNSHPQTNSFSRRHSLVFARSADEAIQNLRTRTGLLRWRSQRRGVLAAHLRPSLLTNATIAAPPKKPREAERRKAHPTIPRGAVRCCHLRALRARKRPDVGGRSPSGAPTAALAKATERSSSAQAALRAKERTRALPASSIALKRSTPRPGHSAGGDDARAARERSYELRAQEPHPLRQSAVTGDVPRTSGHFFVT